MVNDAARLLLIEESDDDAVLIARAFSHAGFRPIAKRVATLPALHQMLADDARWDVIMCGTMVPRLELSDAIDLLRRRSRDALLVALSSRGPAEPPEVSHGSVDGLLCKERLEDLPALVAGLMHGPRACR
jgi:hypothetical protein